MNTPCSTADIRLSWATATTLIPTPQPTPVDVYACRQEHHRLRDLAQPWIRQISASWPVLHPAVLDFNLANERFSRLDDPARLPQALAQVRHAVEYLQQIAAPPSSMGMGMGTDAEADAAAMPPPRSSAVPRAPLRRGAGSERLNQVRLAWSGVVLAAESSGPAALDLLKMRRHMLTRLDEIAARDVQAGSPTDQDHPRADCAMTRITQILDACRSLFALPEARLAALAAEERRVAKRQLDLIGENSAAHAVFKTSHERISRMFAVHTAGTIKRHTSALSAYEDFLDGLVCRPPAPRGSASDVPGQSADGDLYDPFGVLTGL
ncbi:hypothetical protein [Roseateles sp.]|uniref:hypothetical protein n=1 Tax=Roseateles sp. TaxID=1971397 RepID=UPI002F42DFE0